MIEHLESMVREQDVTDTTKTALTFSMCSADLVRHLRIKVLCTGNYDGRRSALRDNVDSDPSCSHGSPHAKLMNIDACDETGS